MIKSKMKIVKPISQDEMVAAFLKSELRSSRFKQQIIQILKRDKVSKRIISTPNLESEQENKYRKEVLAEYRGYGKNIRLFSEFPKDITWNRVRIKKSDFKRIKYILGVGWNELSNYTRSPKIGAKQVKKNISVPGIDSSIFWSIVKDIEKGAKIPEMILVSKDPSNELILLEGHSRITAYMLSPQHLPDELEVIVGFSENIHKWKGY
jgi:hypothetical protein